MLIVSSVSPGKLHVESLFTPPFRVLDIFDCPAALRFLFQRFNYMVGVVRYPPRQLQITVTSETNFEFNLLEETRVNFHNDMLHAFHSLASICVANHRPGPMPLPWLSSSRIKIVNPDLQVQLCPR